MHFRSGLVALAIISALRPTPTFAVVCLSKSMTMDEIVEVIGAAPSCERAMKIFQDCQMSTSGDIHLGEAVEKKCEADFLVRFRPAPKAAYQREMNTCDRKYQNQSGTMYRSFTAFCRAEVAQRYSQRALKGKR
jgi:hypothetical protein